MTDELLASATKEIEELATGGTARAMCQLVENSGGVVAGIVFLIELSHLKVVAGIVFLIELSHLNGRKHLAPYTVTPLLTYDDRR